MKYFIVIILLISQVLFAKNKLNDKEFELYLLKASNSISMEFYKDAYVNLEKALLYNPENINNKLYIAIFFAGIKKYINSLTVIFRTPELKNNQIAQFYVYYNYYFIQKDLEEMGIKQFNESKNFLLKNNNELGEDKLLFLSVATYSNNDKKSSLVFFKKAISKNENILSLDYQVNFGKDIVYNIYKNLSPPYDASYYNSLAKIQIRLKNEKLAILTLKKVLKIDKNNHIAKKLLGEAYINLKEYDIAFKYLSTVKSFFFDDEEVILYFKKIYEYKKDNKNVLVVCNNGLKQLPYSQKLRYCVAEALYKDKKYSKSLFNLEYLLNQYPNSVDINFLTGQVLEDFVKKISLMEGGSQKSKSQSKILKNFKEPMEYYIRAIELNPIEPKIMKKMFGNIVHGLLTLPATKDLEEKKIDDIKLKANNSFLKYYEPFALKENVELANTEFYEKFVKYLKNKSPKILKDLGYLSVGKTILLYLDFLNTQNNDKLFNKFMKIYSKKYFEIMKKKYHFNQFIYYFNLENNVKSIEQLKVFSFIIPSYFD